MMHNKKMIVLPFMAILMLSVVGVAYAHWSDFIKIAGYAEMGSLTLAFDPDEILGCVDNEPTLPVPKDVAWCDVYYDPDSYVYDEHTDKYGYKVLVFEIYNAYPQYEVNLVTVVPHNIGTVPLVITDFNMWDPTGELEFVWTTPPPASPAYGYFWKDFDGDGVYDQDTEEIINVKIVNFVGVQLDPCESTKGEIDFEFKQPAEECHHYYFKVELVGIQFNKAP
jgi:hypothetical protein